VDTLLGDSRKARKELNWQPKTNIKTLVKEMINSELQRL
jgi:GDPmannose 4,6-dehydratase